jgi:hypothetical protein
VHRGRGETHLAGQLGVAGPAVGPQQLDQVLVDGVDGVVSVLVATGSPGRPRFSVGTEYRRGRTLGRDEGV